MGCQIKGQPLNDRMSSLFKRRLQNDIGVTFNQSLLWVANLLKPSFARLVNPAGNKLKDINISLTD